MNKYFLKFALPFLLFMAFTSSARADAAADWRQIEEFEKGPKQEAVSKEEMLRRVKLHLQTELQATKNFVKNYPSDPKVFEARIIQAGVLAALGKLQNDNKMTNDALTLYANLEKMPGLSPKLQSDVSFCRVSLYIQNVDQSVPQGRELILNSIENFKARYPTDPRTPRLLVEAASIYDDLPDKKRALILEAKELSKDEELNLRITDDMRRLDQLNKPVSIKLETIQGGEINTDALRGKVVAILFWAAESAHCQLWLKNFRGFSSKLSPNSVAIVTISLDTKRSNLKKIMDLYSIQWPTYFDGKGWETPIARQLGINALPTLWLLDKKGNLRTLNARDNYDIWIRTLQREN
ncbi:MAG: TlpA disulfide reductase family protein [Chthoniobacterales bacterium]